MQRMGSVPILSINVNITKDTMLKFDGDANTNVNIDAKSGRTFTKQPNFLFRFVTACNSSCGKVMFSQACVIPSVHREGVGVIPACNGMGVSARGCLPGGGCVCPGGVSARGGGVYHTPLRQPLKRAVRILLGKHFC